jgi:hypothetical protein
VFARKCLDSGVSHLVFEYPLTPSSGNAAIVNEYTHPTAIILPAVLSFNLLLRWIAYVIVYQRSLVITVSVKIDSSLANTVRNPATWHPGPKTKKRFQNGKNILEIILYFLFHVNVLNSYDVFLI